MGVDKTTLRESADHDDASRGHSIVDMRLGAHKEDRAATRVSHNELPSNEVA